QYLRKSQRPVILVANKADQLPVDSRHVAFYELGLGDPFPVSAAVGKSSGDLLDRVVALLPPAGAVTAEAAIDVAVVGRPNVGKSSLVNRLLGSERLVVAAEPGTTRDAIDTPLQYGDRTLVFIDTAGLRKRSKVDDDIEFYSTLRTARAIERADVCVLVVDAQDGMHVQDLKIANDAWERGAALIVAVNKWDLIEEKDTNTAVRGEREIKGRAPFLEFIPFIYVSAKTGQRTTKLLELILAVATERDKRIPTHEVNEVLGALVERQQPPQPVGESVRLLYASQIGTAPPRFAIVSNRPEAIPESYTRYLLNGFREAWRFTGSRPCWGACTRPTSASRGGRGWRLRPGCSSRSPRWRWRSRCPSGARRCGSPGTSPPRRLPPRRCFRCGCGSPSPMRRTPSGRAWCSLCSLRTR